MTPKLNIGLSWYQETEWIAAINRYGLGIMDKSLLSSGQKAILAKAAQEEREMLSSWRMARNMK